MEDFTQINVLAWTCTAFAHLIIGCAIWYPKTGNLHYIQKATKVKNRIPTVLYSIPKSSAQFIWQTVLKMWKTQPLSKMVQKQKESKFSNTNDGTDKKLLVGTLTKDAKTKI